MEEDTKRISVVLIEAMRAKSTNVEKLSQQTGISERYITALLEEKPNRLPAVPYVHGYVMRMAQVLDLDGEKLWQAHMRFNEGTRRSGKDDVLPPNRFEQKILMKRGIIVVVTLLIVAAIAAGRAVYLQNPGIEFFNLEDQVTIATSTSFIIKGRVDPSFKLTFGNEEVVLNKEGNFTKEVVLEPGVNTFTFKVKKVLGKERMFVKQIFYQAPATQESFNEEEFFFEEEEATSTHNGKKIQRN